MRRADISKLNLSVLLDFAESDHIAFGKLFRSQKWSARRPLKGGARANIQRFQGVVAGGFEEVSY